MEKEETKMNTDDVYRQQYEKARAESESEIDNYIKYLAGGALVISLTFIGNILPTGKGVNTKDIWLIISAWVLLVIALVVNFISHFLTIRNSRKAVDEIDDGSKDWIKNVKKRNKAITVLNYIAAILSILGVIGITLFVSLNIHNYG